MKDTMLTVPVHDPQTVLSFLKKTVDKAPSLLSPLSMTNLKRQRESPIPEKNPTSSTPSLPTSAFDPPSQASHLYAVSQQLPLNQQHEYTQITYHHRPAKRTRIMSNQPYSNNTTTSASSFGHYAPVSSASYTSDPNMAVTYTRPMDIPARYGLHEHSPGPVSDYGNLASGAPAGDQGGYQYPIHPTYPMQPGDSPQIQLAPLQSIEAERKQRRQQQNREAQKNFRDRQRSKHQELESRVDTLERDLQSANDARAVLEAKLDQITMERDRLKGELQRSRR